MRRDRTMNARRFQACAALLLAGLYFTPAPAWAETPDAQTLHDLAADLADAWMTRHPAQTMAWNWKEAVLALGLQVVHQDTNDPAVLQYLQDWVDFHLTRGVHINRSDTVVPATSALYLFQVTGDEAYLEVVDQCHTYLDDRAPKLSDGSIAHTMATPHQIWVDSLFMFGTFYTMDGAITGNRASFDTLALQFSLFQQHLLSARLGLFRHMYDEVIDQQIPTTPTFWARGNGWALASLALLLTDLPPTHPDRTALENTFASHAQAVMAWQDPSGLWWTVLNRPGDTYLETSASALFAFALLRGYRLGLLDDRAGHAADRALEALVGVIEPGEDGLPVVTGISLATNPGPFWMYARVPVGDDEPYGVGAVMMAFEEAGVRR